MVSAPSKIFFKIFKQFIAPKPASSAKVSRPMWTIRPRWPLISARFPSWHRGYRRHRWNRNIVSIRRMSSSIRLIPLIWTSSTLTPPQRRRRHHQHHSISTTLRPRAAQYHSTTTIIHTIITTTITRKCGQTPPPTPPTKHHGQNRHQQVHSRLAHPLTTESFDLPHLGN